jgi:structural maintenance of chromosome 2
MASLISLAAGDFHKSTALEIVADAILNNVVVGGREVVFGGRLKKRVTVIPLNRISAFRMADKVRVYFSLFFTCMWVQDTE